MNASKAGDVAKRLSLGWLCVLIVVGFLSVGLWPFNPFQQNEVEWLQGENGIRFHGRGLVFGLDNARAVAPQPWGRNGLTLELWLKPEREPHRSVPVFFTMYDPHTLEAVTLGQWRSGLIVRWKNLDAPLNFKEFGVRDVLVAGERRILAITFNASRSAVFADGNLKRQYASNPLVNLDGTSIRFVLGNSPNGRDGWAGDLFALAVYNRSLSSDEVSRNYNNWMTKGWPDIAAQNDLVGLFTFTEKHGERAGNQITPESHLRIPRYFQPLQKEILTPTWKDFQVTRRYLMDMTVNFLGFIPFGVFLAVWCSRSCRLSKRTAFLSTVLISAVLSCSVELLQAWIPLRDSQMMDVLMNTSGAAVGALFAAWSGKTYTE